jgi:hypothetical protein
MSKVIKYRMMNDGDAILISVNYSLVGITARLN